MIESHAKGYSLVSHTVGQGSDGTSRSTTALFSAPTAS